MNPAGLDFYDRLIDLLLANGISPMATLYHWDTPLPLDEAGGWMNRDTAYRLGDFAAIAAAAFGDRVRRWVTVNEPATVTTNGYALGMHAPGEALMLKALPSVHHQLLGHGLALQALRAAKVPGDIGITNVYSPMVPATANPLDKVSAGLMDVAQNRLYADPVLLGKYPDVIRAATFFSSSFSPSSEDMELISQPLDFYGLNYYMPTRVAVGSGRGGRAARHGRGHGGRPQAGHPVRRSTSRRSRTPRPRPTAGRSSPNTCPSPWPRWPTATRICPRSIITEGGASFEDVVVQASGRPTTISRTNGACVTLRTTSARPWKRHVPAAPPRPIDLRGYYVWSFMDNFEWSAGYKQPFGLVHVDFDTQVRTPKASYYWLQEVIAARSSASAESPAAQRSPAAPAGRTEPPTSESRTRRADAPQAGST